MLVSRRQALSLVLLLAACTTGEPTASSSPSYLRARIEGAATSSYEGSGDFWTGGSPEMGHPFTFGVNSRARDAAREQSFSLWRQQKGRPGEGSYSLAPPDYSRAEWESFAATFTRTEGEMVEAYVARSGSLRITSASSGRITGTFQFSGIRYCARSRSGTPRMEGSCRPDEVDPAAPTIEVTGSFVAVPFDTGGISFR